MAMPERLPSSVPSSPEGPASTASAGRVVAAPVVASAEFTAGPKRRSFTAKYKLQILSETDRAVDKGGSQPFFAGKACIPRPWATGGASVKRGPWARCSRVSAGRKRLRRTLCRPHLPKPIVRMPLCAAAWIRRKRSSPSKKKVLRCWTIWSRHPAAAANRDGGSRDGGSRGFDPGQRPDGGHLHGTCGVTRLCGSASCGADGSAAPGNTADTFSACLAGK